MDHSVIQEECDAMKCTETYFSVLILLTSLMSASAHVWFNYYLLKTCTHTTCKTMFSVCVCVCVCMCICAWKNLMHTWLYSISMFTFIWTDSICLLPVLSLTQCQDIISILINFKFKNNIWSNYTFSLEPCLILVIVP